jgi:AraC-like DNA-binding protein
VATRRDPVREWREGFARRMHSIDFKPIPDALFHASVTPILHGVRTALSPGFTFRDKELVRDTGAEAFSLIFSRSKNLDVAQCGREVRLRRGDATLLHVAETGHVGSYQPFEIVAQIIPQTELVARGANLDAGVARRLPARTEALHLLRGYIGSIERRKSALSAETSETARRHVIDLAVLAFTSRNRLGESDLSAVAAARLQAALDHIASHFDEPGFGITAVARRQGVSARYVQRLLETSGAAFTTRVHELRLQRALELLGEVSTSRISDIALQVGFSDISQFNRLFRARFGDTPSAFRARGRS